MSDNRGFLPLSTLIIIIVVATLSVGAGVFVFLGGPKPISPIIEKGQEDKKLGEIEETLPEDNQDNFIEDLIKSFEKVIEPVKEDIQQPLPPPVFTHHVIDLSHYQSLIPPGSVSLNTFAEHGYLTLKEDVERSPIYAPTDADVLSITYYSYSDPWTPMRDQYDLSLIIHEDISLYIGHLAELVPKLKAVAPQQPREHSRDWLGLTNTSVKAGELIGYVVGGAVWDFGAYDKSNQNIVANMDRHWNKWDNVPGKYVFGVCPYKYYPDDMRQEYLNLMDGKKCRNASRDVPGTAAGYWFADDSFNMIEDDFFYFGGDYSLRFVIASTGDGGVQWGGVGMGTDEADVGVSPTDPADLQVGDSFCYKNDLDWVDTGKNYLFVKLLSETELGLFYGEGKCPITFPEEGYKVYMR